MSLIVDAENGGETLKNNSKTFHNAEPKSFSVNV